MLDTQRLRTEAVRDEWIAIARDMESDIKRIASEGITSERDWSIVQIVLFGVLGDIAYRDPSASQLCRVAAKGRA